MNIPLPLRYFLFFLLASLCIVGASRCGRKSSSFAALDKETRYVGDKTCESCHKKIYASYLETGMGKSFYVPNSSKIIEKTGIATAVKDSASNFFYYAFWRGDSMYIREFRVENADTIHSRIERVDYVVGSGNQTRSYLMERQGYLYEMPITWYVSKQIWDMSPGYDKGANSRFSREIGEECMACHTGNFTFEKGSKNKFSQIAMGIGCEQCHGPGSVHVAKMEKDELVDVGKETDYSIVNPEKLDLDAQFDVCQQCHLQGTNVLKTESVRDFRPSMHLNEIYDVFVEKREGTSFGIASHADRLKQSQCFIQSKGKMNCTTCHDPHQSVHKTEPLYFAKQCQNCHKTHTCAHPDAKNMTAEKNCVTCHLPKGGTVDIPHVSFHDHKIRVVEAAKTEAEVNTLNNFVELMAATPGASTDATGRAHLQYYETQKKHPQYLEIAAKNLGENSLYEKARLAFYQNNFSSALELIEKALKANADEPYYLFLKGEILEAQGKFEPAYQAYKSIPPAMTEAAGKAAICLMKAKPGDKNSLLDAEKQFQILLKKKPQDERYLSNYGFILLNKGEIPAAEAQFLQALHLSPDYIPAMENLISLYLATGQKAKAQNWAKRLLKLSPQHPKKSRLEAI